MVGDILLNKCARIRKFASFLISNKNVLDYSLRQIALT